MVTRLLTCAALGILATALTAAEPKAATTASTPARPPAQQPAAGTAPAPTHPSAQPAQQLPPPLVKIETVVIDTGDSKMPQINLFLRLPKDAKDGSKVAGVLCYCTWEGDPVEVRKSIEGTGRAWGKLMTDYAEKNNLATITWTTKGLYRLDKSADEMNRRESLAEEPRFDSAADAWEKGINRLSLRNKIPDHNFLLAGISRGAQWAHRLALRYPKRFLAVHAHVNSTYDEPTKEGAQLLWLVTTGEREYGAPAGIRFYKQCRDIGYPIMFKIQPRIGHADSPEIRRLGFAFFDYALSKAAVPKSKDKDPFTTVQAPWTSDFAAPPFYADFINGGVQPASKKDMIPVSQRLPVVSEAIAKAWGK